MGPSVSCMWCSGVQKVSGLICWRSLEGAEAGMHSEITAKPEANKRRFWSWAALGQRLFGIYLATVLMLIIFVAPGEAYAAKRPTALVNPLYCVLAVLVVLGGCFLKAMLWPNQHTDVAAFPLGLMDEVRQAEQRKSPHWLFPAIIGIGSVLLFLLQMFIMSQAFFVTGWDAGIVTSSEAANNKAYFSNYPNQLFLAGVFAKLMAYGAHLGLMNGYGLLVGVSCLCVTLSLVLVTYVARRLCGTGAACVFFTVAAVFVGLSPWILVPYSDTYGMLFTSLILWFYVCCPIASIRWFGIALCSCIGYAIKPTIVFALVAIVAAEACACITRFGNKQKTVAGPAVFITNSPQRRGLRRVAMSALTVMAALLGFLLGNALVSQGSLKVEGLDGSKAFSATHFLMMGFNPQTRGVYSLEDVQLSDAQPNPRARRDKNLSVFKERLENAGFGQTLMLLGDKVCTNYADGTFAWKVEGNFVVHTSRDNTLIKKIYGIKNEDVPFAPIFQVIWFAVLLGALICVLKRGYAGKYVNMMGFSLLFLSGFLTLFECRARYLFLYSPYFILLAVVGWQHVADWAHARRARLV